MKVKPQNLSSWVRNMGIALCLVFMGMTSVAAHNGIEGKWKDHKNGAVILIYEEDGMYYGQLISVDDPGKNEKVQERDKIVLLRNFKKTSETEFCCGKIYQPKHKRVVDGTLVLKDENTLKVTGRLGIIKGTQTWTKLHN